jgi:deazaflavin-dependent oxidoreductase (nitroreductase family)
MIQVLLSLAGLLVLAVAAIAALFLLGMRGKWPFVLDTVRRMNRRVINPRQLRTAGTPGADAAIISHTGRVTGREFQTPVGAEPTDDGFVIALPYGSRADWVRNVLASGHATIRRDGVDHEVERPELVPTSAMRAWFSAADLRTFRLMRVDQCLRLRRAAG